MRTSAPLLRTIRSEAIKTGTLLDSRIAAVVLVAVCCGWAAWAGLSDDRAVAVDPSGYFSPRTLPPLSGIALTIIGPLAALSATSEYESGMVDASHLAVPRRSRLFLAKCAAQLGLCFAAGILVSLLMLAAAGLGSGYLGTLPADPVPAVAQLGRAGLAFAVVGMLGLGVGTLVKGSATSWALFFLRPTLGERVLSSLPGIGGVAGPVMPFRNADYFLLGSSHGAPYAWGADAAIAVPAAWALLSLFAAGITITGPDRRVPRKTKDHQ